MNQNSLMPMVGALTIAALLIALIMAILALIGSVKITDGCLFRYNMQADGTVSSADALESTAVLKANGNYVALEQQDGSVIPNPAHYGQWLNTKFNVAGNKKIVLKVNGEVSLCRAYLPINNLQSDSDLDSNKNKIPIPRIEEAGVDPMSLVFDAKTDEWRNLTEIFPYDQLVVSVMKDQKDSDAANIVMRDIFSGSILNANCSADKISYSPLCGRYSIYSGQYLSGCYWNTKCSQHCRRECKGFDLLGWCIEGYSTVCNDIGCWREEFSNAPQGYKFDGSYTFSWSDQISNLSLPTSVQCSQDHEFVKTDQYQKQLKFWYSADDASGLLHRLDHSKFITNPKSVGESYAFAKLSENQGAYANGNVNSKYKIILDKTFSDQSDVKYLQYRFLSQDNKFQQNTGGYVLNLKHTKCKRSNGKFVSDTFTNRGAIQYVIAPLYQDPNTQNVGNVANLSIRNLEISDTEGNAVIEVPEDSNGILWMRVLNDPKDYQDSAGQYSIHIFTSKPTGSFAVSILNPLFTLLKTKINNASVKIFKNMTCYNGSSGYFSSCINFFNYIKAILIIYIMLYGAMFLLGVTKISQLDLVIRVIKIAIVAGLMNGKTFNFFNDYVFHFVTNFSDSIIADMSGYSLFTSGSISNPFMFLDSLMTKVLFSKTFFAQVLALLALGISGLLYFVLVFVALVIVVISVLRAIAIYVMAFMSIAVLIGLAPLFLTFILFDATRHLFDNWVKFTIRYMLEPVILMAGIIILTQLFTIYLDFVIGYSVCWKCVIPFKMPFPNLSGFNPAFSNLPLFCIYWFAPWGFDSFSGMMGLNMQHIIVLIIISYCIWGYSDLSSKLVFKLTGSMGPSATHMGQNMSNTFENKVLEQMGLDKEGREKIQSEAKQRLGIRDKALEEKERSNMQDTSQEQDKSSKSDQASLNSTSASSSAENTTSSSNGNTTSNPTSNSNIRGT